MSAEQWKSYTQKLYSNESLGFFLDTSELLLQEEDMAPYIPHLSKSIQEMVNLESGAIANPDENRRVGHYWLRAPDLAPEPQLSAEISSVQAKIDTFSKRILGGDILSPTGMPFQHVLVIGIGGSALGPQFIIDALGKSSGLPVAFLDNTDPDGIDSTLMQIGENLSNTLVIVISKSGGTAETRNGMLEAQQRFETLNLNFPSQAVAITGEGSNLYKTAKSEEWLEIFPMWDWVGGRTSVMSGVGLLPAALAGVSISELLEGARQMDVLTRSNEQNDNPAAILAMAWLVIGNARGEKDMVILPYKDNLILFSRYLQQLIMESLGKRLDLDGKRVDQGIAVYGNKGSTDQHAYVQQLRDGLDNFFVTFIEVLKDRTGSSIHVDGLNSSGDYLFGFLKGTQTALSQNDRKSITISIEEVNARSIGALIALYERTVGLYASAVNINAYHQPGVEAGKLAAGRVLDIKNQILSFLGEHQALFSVEELCQELNLEDEEVLVYHILRHHLANTDLDVEGSIYEPSSLRVGAPKK